VSPSPSPSPSPSRTTEAAAFFAGAGSAEIFHTGGMDELRADLREGQRTAALEFLRTHPWCSLAELAELVKRVPALGRVTCGELGACRLGRDELLAARVLMQLGSGGWVASGQLLAAAGCERWDLGRVMASLVEAGRVERKGRTSGRRYRLAVPARPPGARVNGGSTGRSGAAAERSRGPWRPSTSDGCQ
jgi:hypothetical protein